MLIISKQYGAKKAQKRRIVSEQTHLFILTQFPWLFRGDSVESFRIYW